MNRRRATSAYHAWSRRLSNALMVAVTVMLVAACLTWATSCDSGPSEPVDETTSTTADGQAPESGDIEGAVGAEVEVGDAVVTVRALQATFQPAMPGQRVSEQTPPPPAPGEGFYQAYVRVENGGVSPIRVDPNDFACAVGNSVVVIEPTRSGPLPRSLLGSTSLDLLLTFKGQAGFVPILIYNPPWYQGTIRISPQAEETTTTS